jgi:hypothetical protein
MAANNAVPLVHGEHPPPFRRPQRYRFCPHDVIPPIPPGAVLLGFEETTFVPLSERRGICSHNGKQRCSLSSTHGWKMVGAVR